MLKVVSKFHQNRVCSFREVPNICERTDGQTDVCKTPGWQFIAGSGFEHRLAKEKQHRKRPPTHRQTRTSSYIIDLLILYLFTFRRILWAKKATAVILLCLWPYCCSNLGSSFKKKFQKVAKERERSENPARCRGSNQRPWFPRNPSDRRVICVRRPRDRRSGWGPRSSLVINPDSGSITI